MASTAHQSELPAEGRTPKSAGAEAPSPPVLDKAAVSAHDLAIPADAEPSLLVQALLCCVSILEGADTQLLGASMRALQEDIGLHLTDLAYMTVSQAVCTNIAAPLWGILADRGILRRRTILLLAATGQGLTVIAFAFMPSLPYMVLCRAFDGALLAALRPISNGIVADVTSENRRGTVFGRLQSGFIMGIFVTGLFVVPMARKTILGFHGWRVAFVMVGTFSMIVAALVGQFLEEPPHTDYGGAKGFRAVVDELWSLLRFFRLPTFCVMIVQGIFGTMPWTALSFMALFFQLSGISDGQVAVIAGAQALSGAIGNMLGGLASDVLARRFGLHGRPLSAQLTVAMGIPIVYFIFVGIPPGTGSFGGYFALMVAFGLLGTWAQSGTNFPILSHIVPPSCRSRVLAWESAFENSIASGIGPVIVASLAEGVFHYTFGQEQKDGVDIPSAVALGRAMAVAICVPWLVCFAVYSMMHYTYPRDIRKLEAQEQKRLAEAQKAKGVDAATAAPAPQHCEKSSAGRVNVAAGEVGV
mmetsp:Transcript_67616/g.189284  ORF Transcript_67616/g.189284 Transcript_67616/m.189284 type:complete len:529 (+) Transcript_67616:70-1656(+)